MKKKSILKEGYTHIVYSIESLEDVIHRFSPRGYELLTDEFMDNQERVRPEVKKDALVLTEITGVSLSEEEKQMIARTVRVHYGLKLAEVNQELKKCRLKIFWFVLSFIVSSALLFMTNNKTNEVVVQYAYLPFWFFGYRVLTYPIFEYYPLWKEKRWISRMVSMHLLFSNRPMEEIPVDLKEDICEKEKERGFAEKIGFGKETLVEEYFLEDGWIGLECTAKDADDILSASGIKGKPLISEELISYLDQAVPFIKNGKAVQMKFSGADFGEEDRKRISTGLKNYFALRVEAAGQEVVKNIRKISLFSAGLFLASLLLFVNGGTAGIAFHEGMLVILWFFGDYLIEYILLNQLQLVREKKIWEKLGHMEVLW